MLTPLVEARARMAEELAGHIRQCVARRDSAHAAFHGCLDWHSAVHGVWALVAYARMTGDRRHAALVAEILDERQRALAGLREHGGKLDRSRNAQGGMGEPGLFHPEALTDPSAGAMIARSPDRT